MLGRKCVVFAALVCVVASEGMLHRMKRQNYPEQGGQVIDKIFNIPITAIKQTAAAAQSFSPENSQLVDSVLQIPVSTLEAVGNLVKATSGQRRQTDDLQRIRQERRERIIAQRERQRAQREQLQQQRIKQQQMKKTFKIKDKDPFGLNSLTFLVGNHGILGSIQGVFGGHGGHGHGGHGGHGGNGGHGGHGPLGSHGSHGSTNNQNTYEVHENVEEDTNYSWHGITAGFGSLYGSRPTQAEITIQNKIAPKDDISNGYKIQHKIASSRDRPRFEEDAPLENKIAPKSNRISFQS
nr:PREDICTED: uncharacterized protein LOC100876722 isoform X1 [Megachile rotundata]